MTVEELNYPLTKSESYEFGWSDSDEAGFNALRGLNEAVVKNISRLKNEPAWMLELRLKGLKLFNRKPLPTWGADLSTIDFDNIKYFVRSTEGQAKNWEDLPEDIKNTYDRLGIPEAEKQRLVAGVAAQYECLAGDTRIYTVGKGLVPISEIKTGTKIYSYDLNSSKTIITRVQDVRQTKIETTYEMILKNRRIKATANHPFLTIERVLPEGRTRRGVWTQKWKTLEELKPGDFVGVSSQLPSFGVTKKLDSVDGFGPSESNEDILLKSQEFQQYCNEFIGFQRIQAINELKAEPVWDIKVSGSDNFIAEGIFAHNSEVIYHSIREDLEEQGVVFLDTDTALKEYPELFKEYFATIIPVGDNKFSALNSAVWSGGSFIYVPKGVHVDIPMQAYFRINTENMGQFERTLIIADEGSYVHYVEGCTAPIYTTDSLHSAVVEIIAKKGAHVRYTTIQNWSNNVYNLVTKRAVCEEGATMEWIDANIGSKITAKYPSVYLMGEASRGSTLSVAFAGKGQHQDAGAKMVHMAPNTQSSVLSKSVARGGGRTSYRGLLAVNKGAKGARATVRCDALLVDTISRSDTYPYVDVREDDVSLGHEATVTKMSEDQLFYLMQRGLTEDEAAATIVRGFIDPVGRHLPFEYAIELNRLIEMQMEGSVG